MDPKEYPPLIFIFPISGNLSLRCAGATAAKGTLALG